MNRDRTGISRGSADTTAAAPTEATRAEGPATHVSAGHGPFAHAEDGGFEPPRAFTQHAFHVPQRGMRGARRCAFVQVSALWEHITPPLDRAGWSETTTKTATSDDHRAT